jgi:aryl-alcohol dehydrogenase-like predicted oxidoreductase
MSQFALRWILMSDAVSCAIPGGKRPQQVGENCCASDLPPLTPGQRSSAFINRRLVLKSITAGEFNNRLENPTERS